MRKRQSGFTLTELVQAIFLLAFGSVILLFISVAVKWAFTYLFWG